jgi:hypothetical protein
VKPVGEPDALIGHVRFDERGWETERCRMAQATAPILDSTFCEVAARPRCGRYRGESGRSRVSAAMQLVVVSFPPKLHVLRSLANMAH